jgi:hypothetical protein
MIEKQPQILCSTQAALNERHLGAVQRHHQLGRGAHRQPVQRVLGEHHQVHRAQVAPRLAHHPGDALGLRTQLRRRLHHRQLQLHQPDHHALRRLVQSTQSAHLERETPSSAGAPFTLRVGEQVQTRIASVST